jgi:hypothetical protein
MNLFTKAPNSLPNTSIETNNKLKYAAIYTRLPFLNNSKFKPDKTYLDRSSTTGEEYSYTYQYSIAFQ